jgi:hypothetical protein
MTELETAIADNKAAVEEFIAAARAVDPSAWHTPRREGAWSRAQIAEHLAIVYEFNRKVLAGTAPGLPALLRPILQPLLRRMVVTNTLKAGGFTRKGRAPGIFQPSATPADATQVLARLTSAVRGFEADIRSRPRGDGTILHPAFGRIGIADWVRIQAIHARHHRNQVTST